ncbi:MAG: isochorismate synthase [Candidatus Binatia bacterium]
MAEHARIETETRVVHEVDLLALAAGSPVRPVFWWQSPSSGRALAAVGAIAEVRATGPERFTTAEGKLRETLHAAGPEAIAVGGFAFAHADPLSAEWRELPAVRFFVPRLLWLCEGEVTRRVRLWRVGEEEETAALLEAVEESARTVHFEAPALHGPILPVARGERRHWRERVESARARIAAGSLAKVVLSRSRRLQLEAPAGASSLLARLAQIRPGCHHFWLGAGATDFLGSTPELLVSRRGGEVASGAIAGTARRGATPAEDASLGEALLACPKSRHEHGLVVDHVLAALAPVTSSLEAAESPRLLRLPEAQHLHTPVRGRLREPLDVLSLAARLHPTPAVCGAPAGLAYRLLEREEPDRGWYAGGVGWMGADGDGEVAVALRSALVDGTTLLLRAGAGIVAGSNPEAELAETEVKLAALVRGLVPRRSERAA